MAVGAPVLRIQQPINAERNQTTTKHTPRQRQPTTRQPRQRPTRLPRRRRHVRAAVRAHRRHRVVRPYALWTAYDEHGGGLLLLDEDGLGGDGLHGLGCGLGWVGELRLVVVVWVGLVVGTVRGRSAHSVVRVGRLTEHKKHR